MKYWNKIGYVKRLMILLTGIILLNCSLSHCYAESKTSDFEREVKPKQEAKKVVEVKPKQETKKVVEVKLKQEAKKELKVKPKPETKKVVEVKPKQEAKKVVEVKLKQEAKKELKVKPKQEANNDFNLEIEKIKKEIEKLSKEKNNLTTKLIELQKKLVKLQKKHNLPHSDFVYKPKSGWYGAKLSPDRKNNYDNEFKYHIKSFTRIDIPKQKQYSFIDLCGSMNMKCTKTIDNQGWVNKGYYTCMMNARKNNFLGFCKSK